MSFNKRILREIAKSTQSKEYDFFCDDTGEYIPSEVNNCYLRWTPEGGLYEGQTHLLCFRFMWGSNVPKVYPRNPPNVKFLTPIFHTNVGTKEGTICLDVLKENGTKQSWSPMYGVDTVLNSIQLLMEVQNPSSPMNSTAGSLYNKSKKQDNEMQAFKDHAMKYYRDKIRNIHEDNFVTRLLRAPEFDPPIVEPSPSPSPMNTNNKPAAVEKIETKQDSS